MSNNLHFNPLTAVEFYNKMVLYCQTNCNSGKVSSFNLNTPNLYRECINQFNTAYHK